MCHDLPCLFSTWSTLTSINYSASSICIHRVSVELVSLDIAVLIPFGVRQDTIVYSLITCMKVEVLKYWRFVPRLSVPILSHNLKSEGKPGGISHVIVCLHHPSTRFSGKVTQNAHHSRYHPHGNQEDARPRQHRTSKVSSGIMSRV